MKKKVIALVIDTPLTNDQIEGSKIRLTVYDPEGEPHGETADARNVRVLDSDEIAAPPKANDMGGHPLPGGVWVDKNTKPDAIRAIGEALGLMNSMILSGEKHSPQSEAALAAARKALARLGA